MLARWKAQLGETHGITAELTRHFFLRLFDTDLVTAPGQLQNLIIGIFAALYSFSLLAPISQFRKYAELPRLVSEEQFRTIAQADRMGYLLFPMFVVAFVVALEWQALFPSRLDSLVLIPLPVTRGRLFAAKFVALLLFTGIFAIAGGGVPAVVLPIVQNGTPRLVLSQLTATAAGCLFTFSALLALEGVFMILPERLHARLSLTLHALLLLVLLCGLPQILTAVALYRRGALPDWFPPLWFLGIEETLAGNAEARFHTWARMGWAAVAVATLLAAALYLVSYFRHTAAHLESTTARPNAWVEPLLRRALARLSPQRFAIASFVFKTLARSRQHKLLLAGYLGIGIAILANSAVLVYWFDPLNRRPDEVQDGMISFSLSVPLVIAFFLISGLRVVFSIPAALESNWVFRLLEDPASRGQWLAAVETAFYLAAVAPTVLIAAPFAWWALGWRALLWHPAACTLLSLILVELMLWEWHKVPFVCSYLPGQHNVSVIFVAYWFVFMLFAYTSTEIESWCLREPWRIMIFVGVLLVCFARLRMMRLGTDRPRQKLLFEDRVVDAYELLRLENT